MTSLPTSIRATPSASEAPRLAQAAVDVERNRIARELHDALSQTLFAANILAGTLSRDETLHEAARGQVQTLERLNRSALAEVRMMLFELRPDTLDCVRLPELLQHAVDALAGRGGVQVSTEVATDPGPPAPQRVQVYRIAQEALANVSRHSRARHVHVGWSVHAGGRGRLHIVDDGCGFDVHAPRSAGTGLAQMKQHAAAIGATLSIQSASNEGTELLLTLNWQ
jgi:signal transduction histidine kinase